MLRRREPAAPKPAPTARQILASLWLGMVAFGILNIPLLILLNSLASGIGITTPGLLPGAMFAVVVGGIAALCALLLDWRFFAAGLLGGYVLMTIASGGVCTLLGQDRGFAERALSGLIIYTLAVFVFLVVLGIVAMVQWVRHR
jgi:hypothetical protein